MNVIEEKSFNFAIKVIKIAKELRSEHREYDLTSQFVRSGTSVGANVSEAQQAQSKKDFIAKMSIAKKEANEVRYWTRLLSATEYLTEEKSKETLQEIEEILKILTSIVKTSQENIHNS